MHALIMHHDGNAESCLLHEIFLDGIILLGSLQGRIGLVVLLDVWAEVFVGAHHLAQAIGKIFLG